MVWLGKLVVTITVLLTIVFICVQGGVEGENVENNITISVLDGIFPISGATVYIYSENNFITSGTTDLNGICKIELDEGIYTIMVKAEGYVDVERTLTLIEDEVIVFQMHGALFGYEYFAYAISVILGVILGAIIVMKIGKPEKKYLFAEHTQSLALAIAATCTATVVGYVATLMTNIYLQTIFLLILMFLLGMSLTIFCIVAYHLYKK